MTRLERGAATRVERVAIVGVGLIGGSFALALKAAQLCGRIVGVGRSHSNMELALERGIVDFVESDLARAAGDADLILIATPVAQIPAVLSAIGGALKPGAIVTDAGSTKRDVVAAARAGLGEKIAQFIPAHPVAGAEHSGAAAATAGLFRGRRVVLAPLAENRDHDVRTLTDLWQCLGARVCRMTPDEHDEIFAAVSHLPHLLAFALVSEIGGRGNSRQLFGYAAGGFRDFTRIASSHPEMWRDICVANRDKLTQEVARFSTRLERVRQFLEAPDCAALERLFADARAARERWLNGEFE